MKSTGIVRRLDELGRITLPIELRRNFDVNERDPLEIFVDDDKIILKKSVCFLNAAVLRAFRTSSARDSPY